MKRSVLGLSALPAVSEQAAMEMASAACRVLGADLGLALTGVAGPAPQDGQPPGTVYAGIAAPGMEAEAVLLRLPGDRDRVRQMATISALDLVRRRLLDLG